MKRSLRVLSVVLFLLLVFNVFNYESVSAEIETRVDSKLDCLSDYGGEIGEVEYNKGVTTGVVQMKVKGNPDILNLGVGWREKDETIEILAYARNGQTLKEINYRIYNNGVSLCTGSLIDIDTSKKSIRFNVIFKQSQWNHFEVTGIDSKGEFKSNSVPVRIDKEPPEILDVDYGRNGKYFEIIVTVAEEKSGIYLQDINIEAIRPDGTKASYSDAVKYTRTNEKFPDRKQLRKKFKYDTYQLGEGEWIFKVNAKDKIGNISKTIEYRVSTLDENGNKIEENFNPSSVTVIDFEKTKEEVKEQEKDDRDDKDKPLGDDCDPDDPDCTLNGGIYISGNRGFTCDKGLTDFIKRYWKWVTILTPALLMAMCTYDFVKAVVSSNADELKKAGTNTIKRVVATLLLVCLPLLLNAVMNLMGVEFCW